MTAPAGIPRSAKTSVSGLKAIYLALKEDVAALASDYTITAGEVVFTTATIDLFARYVMQKESASFNDVLTFAPTTGQKVYDQTLNAMFATNTTAKTAAIEELCDNELVAILEDYNGLCVVVGLERGIDAITVDYSTGVDGTTDLNGASLTFAAKSSFKSPNISSDFVHPVTP